MAAHLYEELISACGLAPMLAGDVIARVCAREAIEASTLTRHQLAAALPAIEKALKLYLGPIALKMAIQHLRALVAPPHKEAR